MEDVVTCLGSDFECRGARTYRSKPTRTVLSREKLLLSVLHALDLGPMLGSHMGDVGVVWGVGAVWGCHLSCLVPQQLPHRKEHLK